jgi:hypothetical protein
MLGVEEDMEEIESTLSRISRLAEERRQLYVKASQSPLMESERRRMVEISRELDALWDQLRRERAARRTRPGAPTATLILEGEAA